MTEFGCQPQMFLFVAGSDDGSVHVRCMQALHKIQIQYGLCILTTRPKLPAVAFAIPLPLLHIQLPYRVGTKCLGACVSLGPCQGSSYRPTVSGCCSVFLRHPAPCQAIQSAGHLPRVIQVHNSTVSLLPPRSLQAIWPFGFQFPPPSS